MSLPKIKPKRKLPEGTFPSINIRRIEEIIKQSIVEIPGQPRPEPRKRERPYGAFLSIDIEKLERNLQGKIIPYEPTYRINLLKKYE